eukprot:4195858-Amphidinium_carterae.1
MFAVSGRPKKAGKVVAAEDAQEGAEEVLQGTAAAKAQIGPKSTKAKNNIASNRAVKGKRFCSLGEPRTYMYYRSASTPVISSDLGA